MRSRGSPDELTHRRWLAVQRVSEGYSTQEVADFLGVDPSTVRRWMATFRDQGAHGLAARPVSGRPRKLTPIQEKIALRWLTESPLHHGFETELWTAPRLGQLIREEFGVPLHPRYLSAWLRDRGFTPQKPQRVPRERDPKAIAAWLRSDWPRIKNKARRLGASIALSDESGLLLLCQLRRNPLRHGHKLTHQQLLGRLEAEPVADLPMHLRQRHPTPIRPRGKKPAAVVPGGSAPVGAATPARPRNCTPASRSPHAGGNPSTAGPDTDPSPAVPWPLHHIALPSVGGARTRPSHPRQPSARRHHPPAAPRAQLAGQAALTPFPPSHRAARPRLLGLNQDVSPLPLPP